MAAVTICEASCRLVRFLHEPFHVVLSLTGTYSFPDRKTVAMNSDRSKSTSNQQDESSILARTVANSYAVPRTESDSPQVKSGEIRVVVLKWKIDGEEKCVTLRPGQTAVFGRTSRRCQHAIPSDRCISGQHFRLECTVSEVRVFDLGSRNGTYVNGKEADSAKIFDGDQIVAGTTLFEFQITRKSCEKA